MIAIIFTYRFTFILVASLAAQLKTWDNKKKEQNQKYKKLNTKIMMTIVMKNTKISQDLLTDIKLPRRKQDLQDLK